MKKFWKMLDKCNTFMGYIGLFIFMFITIFGEPSLKSCTLGIISLTLIITGKEEKE